MNEVISALTTASHHREAGLGFEPLRSDAIHGLACVPTGSQTIPGLPGALLANPDFDKQHAVAVTRPLHTLIIDDNKDLTKLFGDLLEVLGCIASIAWTGESGLAMAEERIPNIIFCDVNMPGDRNGLDVAREIRSNKDFDETLLVAITAFDDPESVAEAHAAGFDKVFGKPIKFAQLAQVVNTYLAIEKLN